MTDEHWFDRLNRELVRSTPRRGVLRSAAALAAGLALGGAPMAAAAKKKDICDKKFSTEKDRRWCRFIRRQCNSPDAQGDFCIVEGDPNNPDKVAVCCPLFSTPQGPVRGRCCPKNTKDQCIPASWKCCPRNHPDASYHSAPPDGECCASDRYTGWCPKREDMVCCPGKGCTQIGTRENCGGCGDNCGNLVCVNGACGCPPNYAECEGALGPFCYDTRTHECCGGTTWPIGRC